jgi:hypothetical protein
MNLSLILDLLFPSRVERRRQDALFDAATEKRMKDNKHLDCTGSAEIWKHLDCCPHKKKP